MNGPTTCDWRPASQPPEIKRGTQIEILVAVLRAAGTKRETWSVEKAVYVRPRPKYIYCSDKSSDHYDGDGYYPDEMNNRDMGEIQVDFWAPMPLPPGVES